MAKIPQSFYKLIPLHWRFEFCLSYALFTVKRLQAPTLFCPVEVAQLARLVESATE